MKISEAQISVALQSMKQAGATAEKEATRSSRAAAPPSDEFIKTLQAALQKDESPVQVSAPIKAAAYSAPAPREDVSSSDIATKLLGRSIVDRMA